MFGLSKKTKQDSATAQQAGAPHASASDAAPGSGKGRPTPTRKEAEAAARAKAKAPRTRKELAAARRAARSEQSGKLREAMRTGDERHLPPRDRGPERRFIRDFVDSRISFLEILMPVVLISLLLGLTGVQSLMNLGQLMTPVALLMAILDSVILRFRVRRQLTTRFPESAHKGATWYAISRAMNMRFMRLPKTQVKLGAELPERYR